MLAKQIDQIRPHWPFEESSKDQSEMVPVHTVVSMHHLDAGKAYREKAWRQFHKDATSYIEQILEATFHKTATVRPPSTHLEGNSN